MNTKAIEDQVVGPVVAHVPEVERIILFGSRARGDARPDSDCDFLIIMPSKERAIRRGFAVRKAATHQWKTYLSPTYTKSAEEP